MGEYRLHEFGGGKRLRFYHCFAESRDQVRSDDRTLGIAKYRRAEKIGEKPCKVA